MSIVNRLRELGDLVIAAGAPTRRSGSGVDAMSADDPQVRVQESIDELVATGVEVGLQVAVLRDGDLVVDAVAGVSDPSHRDRVAPETLFFAASTAKGVAATVAHVLVERGDLHYDVRTVDVWPAFGARGKERVTLRQVLLHMAGVPAPPYDTTIEELCDWDHMCEVFADAEPWWEPGTRFRYHAQTFGFLLGEIVRRATGRTLASCLRELVTAPLGVEDEVHFSVPEPLVGRVATQVPPMGAMPEPPEPGSAIDRAIPPGVRPDAAYANRSDVLTSDIPSHGTMTARGAATIYSALLGHLDGVDLVSARRRVDLAEPKFSGKDEVMGIATTWPSGTAHNVPVACRPARDRPSAWWG